MGKIDWLRKAWRVTMRGWSRNGFVTKDSNNGLYRHEATKIITRAEATKILHGITRAQSCGFAKEAQMAFGGKNELYHPREAQQADEAFTTSGQRLVMPVVRDSTGVALGDGTRAGSRPRLPRNLS